MLAYFAGTITWTAVFILLWSGLSHLRKLRALTLALADRRIPSSARRVLAPGVAAIELALGSAMLLSQVLHLHAKRMVFVATAVWFAVLATDLIRTRLSAPSASCGCPGADGPIRALVIGRAVVLALLCAWLATQDPAWLSHGVEQQVTVLLNALTLTVVVLLAPLLSVARPAAEAPWR